MRNVSFLLKFSVGLTLSYESFLLDMFFGVGGIGLEIAGFVMLLKYIRDPSYDDLQKWIKNLPNTKKYEDVWKHQNAYMKFEAMHEGDEIRFIKPQQFVKFWNNRKNLGIYFVIAGLSGQIVQILSAYLF